MKRTLIPCSRSVLVLDQGSEKIPPYLDYLVSRNEAFPGEAVGICIDEVDGVELVYVAGVKDPIASMLPDKIENDEMLEGIFNGWSVRLPLSRVKVSKKADHFIACSGHSVLCRSKNLKYVQNKLKQRAWAGDVKVSYSFVSND